MEQFKPGVPATDVMFCANDTEQHTVRWGEVAQSWMLENPKVGLVASSAHLQNALGLLWLATGQQDSTQWTIEEQP